MSNGLDQLDNQREKATGRSVPPPKHPARSTPVGSSESPAAEIPSAPQPKAGKSQTTPKIQPADDPLISATVYLSVPNDDFLEDVKRAGRRSKPKIDANRSAVVRLALTRLAEQMTPEQVAQELSARSGRLPGSTGRTRL